MILQLQQIFPPARDQSGRSRWVHEVEDETDRDQQIAEHYAKPILAKKSALVISPTHKVAELLILAIRETVKAWTHHRARIRSDIAQTASYDGR